MFKTYGMCVHGENMTCCDICSGMRNETLPEAVKERKMVYYIENPAGLWFGMDIMALEMHYPDRRSCRCKKCSGDYSPTYFFSSKGGWHFETREHAERALGELKNNRKKTHILNKEGGDEYFFYVNWDRMEDNIKSVDDCFVSEHEFIK